jgi:hypothetical protein
MTNMTQTDRQTAKVPTDEEVSRALDDAEFARRQPFRLEELAGKSVSGVEIVRDLPEGAISFLKTRYSDGTFSAVAGFGDYGNKSSVVDEYIKRGGVDAAYFDGTQLRAFRIELPRIGEED